MNATTKRSILRSIHLIVSIPILGYIYGKPSEVAQYASAVRFVFLPVIVLSGFWMWKGHVLRRLISKRSALHDAAANRRPAGQLSDSDNLSATVAANTAFAGVAELAC